MEVFGFILPVTGKLSLIPGKIITDVLIDDKISIEKEDGIRKFHMDSN
jgi:hypothetical protein